MDLILAFLALPSLLLTKQISAQNLAPMSE